MRAVLSLLLSLLLLLVMAPAGMAEPDDNGSASLKAWTADVSPDLVEELRLAGLGVTAQEVIDEETIRVEVIATGKQVAEFRDEAQFTRTRGQQRVDRTPDVATGDNVFRAYDGTDGLEAEMVAIANANPDLVKLVDIGDTVEGRDIWAL